MLGRVFVFSIHLAVLCREWTLSRTLRVCGRIKTGLPCKQTKRLIHHSSNYNWNNNIFLSRNCSIRDLLPEGKLPRRTLCSKCFKSTLPRRATLCRKQPARRKLRLELPSLPLQRARGPNREMTRRWQRIKRWETKQRFLLGPMLTLQGFEAKDNANFRICCWLSCNVILEYFIMIL